METERNRPKIFIMDDEPLIVPTLVAILNNSGFRTTGFTDPVAALDAVNSEPPGILITDIMMPQMSGVELAIRFREVCPGCKIILFSGQAKTADVLDRAREQAHDFHILAKPVHPKDLLTAITQPYVRWPIEQQ